jgi:hypothetical protein
MPKGIKRLTMTETPPPSVTIREESSDDNVTSESETEELENSLSKEDLNVQHLIFKIVQNNPPLSNTHPGYLLAFHDYLQNNQVKDYPYVQEALPHLFKIVQIWQNSIKRIKKSQSVLVYLNSLHDLTGITFQTSLSAKIMTRLLGLLNIFKESFEFTKEDLSSLVSTRITSTSSTTVRSRTKGAGASGSSKRKLCMDSDEEIDLPSEGPCATRSDLPTYRTYSSTSAYKGGKPYILKSEDTWNDYMMKIQLWKSKDLKDVYQSDWQTKAKRVRKTMIFHFSEKNTSISVPLRGIEEAVRQSLEKKNAQWEENKYVAWKK